MKGNMKVNKRGINKFNSIINNRYGLSFLLLIVLFLTLFTANICMGTVDISISEILDILFREGNLNTMSRIVWDIRLPRAIMAALLGGALALSGFLLQTFFANPIAGPFVLGISSGAKLVVAFLMVFSISFGVMPNSAVMIGAAFIGAMASLGIVLLITNGVKISSMLIISGVMIGYICSAITEIIIAFASDSNIVNLHNWSLGSFSGMNWSNVKTASIVVIITSCLTFLMAKPINAYQLGEGYARSVGVNIKTFRIQLIVLSGILSATVTAFAGPISFVGIAVPHLVKSLTGTSKPIIIIPMSFLLGSIFCLLCDLIARTMFAPTELSISAVTAVFGAPVVIWIMVRRHRRVNN